MFCSTVSPLRLDVQCEVVDSEINHILPAFSVVRRECGLQREPLLFSCAGHSPKYRRLCPCRDFRRGQVALCRDCLWWQATRRTPPKSWMRNGSWVVMSRAKESGELNGQKVRTCGALGSNGCSTMENRQGPDWVKQRLFGRWVTSTRKKVHVEFVGRGMQWCWRALSELEWLARLSKY